MGLTIQQAIDSASEQFTQSDTARLDAELLLAHVLQQNRTWLHTWSDRQLDANQQQQFNQLVARRRNGEPVAYILGEQAFWSLTLQVNQHTLIPRPETEHLVEAALEKIPVDARWRILDLGTGSGAIALAIARERPACEVIAVDRSLPALQTAKANATLNQVNNVTFIESNWFAALSAQKFAIIVANPPYVCDEDPHLQQGDVRFEPRSALASGQDGLEDIRLIIQHSPKWLSQDGWLILEHGFNQAAAIASLLDKYGFREIHTTRDYAGQHRITEAQY